MFPSLHATIRAALTSADPQIITQFILEPLAFPVILADFKSHGENFAHQLSYMTRTYAFYMHREYENLVKNLNNPTLPNNQPMNETYIFSISAANYDVTPGHGVPATTHQDRVPQPGQGHGSDDREQMVSDRMPAISCTSQLSCKVVPHTTTISTDQCRAASVNSARNVASRTDSIRYRENIRSEPISDCPNVRETQTGCGSVSGGGAGVV